MLQVDLERFWSFIEENTNALDLLGEGVSRPTWKTKCSRQAEPKMADGAHDILFDVLFAQGLHRDLRNRCDRGADRRVIGASLQRAQQSKAAFR